LPAQRIHLKAGIIGQRNSSDGPRHEFRLAARVLQKRFTALRGYLNEPNPVERHEKRVQTHQQRGNLTVFPTITRRDDQCDSMSEGVVCQGSITSPRTFFDKPLDASLGRQILPRSEWSSPAQQLLGSDQAFGQEPPL
jgi:hypothetical protein